MKGHEAEGFRNVRFEERQLNWSKFMSELQKGVAEVFEVVEWSAHNVLTEDHGIEREISG
jgi:hypothetical protein